jgi:ABC-2 type transport system ATP-binding protein
LDLRICTRVAIINLSRLILESTIEDLTRADGEFAVRVRRPAEALALIRAQPWGASARLDGQDSIITPAPNGGSAALNLFLVQSGIAPEAIAERAQDLEQIFLRLTGSATSAPQEATQ